MGKKFEDLDPDSGKKTLDGCMKKMKEIEEDPEISEKIHKVFSENNDDIAAMCATIDTSRYGGAPIDLIILSAMKMGIYFGLGLNNPTESK